MQVEYKDKKLSIRYFLYEIVHHCNLNCKSCDHCSPLAKEEFVDIKLYEKDIKQMKKLFNNIRLIGIMGGEPLLHPQITKILAITRKNVYKNTNIQLWTNGIFLDRMNSEFWKSMSKNRIEIILTRYNINLNYQRIYELIRTHKIMFYFERPLEIKEKKFLKAKYDLTGSQDVKISDEKCYHGHVCTTLENGRLYKCPICPAARHFNEYFKTDMEISENDSINIYKCKKEDVVKYFENPIPFCRYCNVLGREENQEWGISKRDISEWT